MADPQRRLNRRDFLSRTSAAAVTAAMPGVVWGQANRIEGTQPVSGRTQRSWFENTWRRAVIDMHIPDWDGAFLSRFDPDAFVNALVTSHAQSVVLYAQSHTGLFNYPTRIGQPHRNLHGRDLVAEVAQRCREHAIHVVLYTSVIHDRWAFDEHPEWCMRHPNGGHYGADSRYGVVCPNSPYREYVRSWVQEICQRYTFDGIRFDMTFWCGVCYCDACRHRWQQEVGGEMPRTVNWLDERWVTLQRKREGWLADFAAVCTDTVRQFQPNATVEHQASSYPLNWTLGAATPLVAHNDFLQGDFYGDALQGSFVRKLLESLTPKRPYGYETSFSLNLQDHTGRKSEELLEAKASAAIADHGAFVFIDAIDPIGTVNPAAHERMGRIFGRLMPYYSLLGGQRVRDVDVYYSLESKFDMRANGKSVLDETGSDSHTETTMQIVRRLVENHVLFGVATRRSWTGIHDNAAGSSQPAETRSRPHGPRILVLSNVHHMHPDECQWIRDYVSGGGCLYASGGTSLVDLQGRQQPDFMLGDVFGVSLVKADWRDRDHYIAPTAAGQALFGDWTPRYPAFARVSGFEVAARPGAQVLATTTLPWPAPDPTRFSSIHSNPPWVPTVRPEVVFNRFGRGQAMYCASLLENVDGLKSTFARMLRFMLRHPILETNAPACVEATLFHQPDRGRYILSLLNFQRDLPNIPVHDIDIRLRLPRPIRRIEAMPAGTVISHETIGDQVVFSWSRLETLAVFAIVL